MISVEHTKARQYRDAFKQEDIVVMQDILLPSVANAVNLDAINLVNENGAKRKLSVQESGDTPRSYSSVGRDKVMERSQSIPDMYSSQELRSLLSYVAGEQINAVPYKPEEYIINHQSDVNDTHGFHWDDYAFAFVMCIEEPDPLALARLEYISGVKWDKNNPKQALCNALRDNTINSVHIRKGECYLMRSNTTLHRVTSLCKETRRTVLVMTFASDKDLNDNTITHTSMEEIYPEMMLN